MEVISIHIGLLEKIQTRYQKRKYDRYRKQALNRNFKEGEKFPFLGSKKEITLKDIQNHSISEGKIKLAKNKVNRTDIKQELKSLYRQKATRYIERKVKRYSKKLNVSYNEIQLRNQRTRWASCTPKQNLSFNW